MSPRRRNWRAFRLPRSVFTYSEQIPNSTAQNWRPWGNANIYVRIRQLGHGTHDWQPTNANSKSAISAVHRPVLTVLTIRRETRLRDCTRSASRFCSSRCTIATAMAMSTNAEAERSEISMPCPICQIRMAGRQHGAYQSLPVMRQCLRKARAQTG